jgi:hypothetical protein
MGEFSTAAFRYEIRSQKALDHAHIEVAALLYAGPPTRCPSGLREVQMTCGDHEYAKLRKRRALH